MEHTPGVYGKNQIKRVCIEIDIDTGNAAFNDDRDAEIHRILSRFADSILRHGLGNNLRQPIIASSGDTVGMFSVTGK
jgi:hypothetical protein